MRPWRGPLPRPRPALVVVLGDFLPILFQSDKEIQSLLNPAGNQVSNLGQDELIMWARSFGRPMINLDLHRAARVTQQQRPLGLLTPPPCTTQVPKPTYAAMVVGPSQTGAQGTHFHGLPPPRGATGVGTSGGHPAQSSGHGGGGAQRPQQHRDLPAGG
jgi:hypothetical protein